MSYEAATGRVSLDKTLYYTCLSNDLIRKFEE